MKVNFLRTKSDGSQEIILTCVETPNGLSFEGNQALIEDLSQEGIFSHTDRNKQLFPADGRVFLDELQYAYNSPYLRATTPRE